MKNIYTLRDVEHFQQAARVELKRFNRFLVIVTLAVLYVAARGVL